MLAFTNGDIGRDEYDAALGFLNEEIRECKVRYTKLKEEVCRRDNAYFPAEVQQLASESIQEKRLSRELLLKAVRRIVVDQNGDLEIEYYLKAA